jgi:hypothetical protein
MPVEYYKLCEGAVRGPEKYVWLESALETIFAFCIIWYEKIKAQARLQTATQVLQLTRHAKVFQASYTGRVGEKQLT